MVHSFCVWLLLLNMLLCIIVLCELFSQMFHCLNMLQFIYLFKQWWTFDSSLELL